MIDQSQLDAIGHVRGPCQVIAGPGAGKTYVLVQRIANMTQNEGIVPTSILVITFTKAAAKEMERRYLKTADSAYSGVTFGTFHSIFFQILRETDHFSYQDILDSKTQRYLLKKAEADCGIHTDHIPDFVNRIFGEFSYIKNSQIPIEEYEPQELTNDEFVRLYGRYEQKKEQLNKLDFDDMLIRTRELLENRPEILEKYRKKFSFYLVDEAQDMNAIQYDILRMLCSPHQNLFLVGDDDQAIYAFRGAKPKLFLRFCKDYPKAKVFRLEYNFRCDRQIVDLGLSVISHNQTRFSKNLRSVSQFDGKVCFLDFHDRTDEAEGIARQIFQEKQKFPMKSIAVLYRNHRQCQWLVKELEKAGLYGTGKTGSKPWFALPLIQGVRDYLMASICPQRGIILRIMNVPQRYLPRAGIEDEVVDFDVWLSMYRDEKDIAFGIRDFAGDLLAIQRLPSFAAVSYILYKIGLATYAKENKLYEAVALEQLFALAKEYSRKQELLEKIEELALEEQEKRSFQKDDESKHISFYTFHGAKGLEFDHVYIIDANEGITPSRHAKRQEEIEEERRMFYVAMTRAKHELSIATIMRQGNEELYPSRFVRELADGYTSASSRISSKTSDTIEASSSESMLSNTGDPSEVSK